MKNKFMLAVIAATLVMGGCAGKADAPAEESAIFEKVDENGQAESENAVSSEDNATSEGDTTSEGGSDAADYTEQIKSEIAAIASGSESLSDELVAVNDLYEK